MCGTGVPLGLPVAAGRRARSRALEGCVRVSRGARGAVRGANAREARGAQCVCARVRGARAPQFSRTPRGGGGGAGVRVTSPRAPVIIARCRSGARIRAEAAAAAAGAGTVASGPGRAGRAGAGRPQRGPRGHSARSRPAALGDLPGSLLRVPAPFSAQGSSARGPREPKSRRELAAAREAQGAEAAAAAPAGTGNYARGRAGASRASGLSGSPRLSLHEQLERLLAGPLRAERTSSLGCKKRRVFIFEHQDSFF